MNIEVVTFLDVETGTDRSVVFVDGVEAARSDGRHVLGDVNVVVHDVHTNDLLTDPDELTYWADSNTDNGISYLTDAAQAAVRHHVAFIVGAYQRKHGR